MSLVSFGLFGSFVHGVQLSFSPFGDHSTGDMSYFGVHRGGAVGEAVLHPASRCGDRRASGRTVAMPTYRRAASERSGSSTVPVLLWLVITSKEPVDRVSNHTRMRLAPGRPLRTIVRHREQQARWPPGTSGSQ